MTEVTSKIENLTPEEAQAAIIRFYELLPEEVWQGSKPSLRSIQFWVDEIQEEATSDIEPFLEMMLRDSNELVLGKTATILLAKLNEYETFKSYIKQAIEDTKRTKGTVSNMTVSFLIFMAFVPSQVEITENGVKINWDNSEPTELVKKAAVTTAVSELFKKVSNKDKEEKKEK